MKRIHASLRTLRAFIRAKTANVAMMFALSLLPLAMAAGAGLDYAQAMMVRAKMLDALDAAALAVGGQPGLSQTAANDLARAVFKANYKGAGSPDITPVIKGQTVSVTATDAVPTTALALFGRKTLSVEATSFVVWGQTKMWVSLVLDNTGSMTQTDSTGLSKMTALIDASHKLLDKLQAAATSPGTSPGDVKVGIVPFAKDVNVGTGNVNASWIDWNDWNTAYDKITNASAWGYTAPISTDGPGTNCPLALGCVTQPGSTTRTSTIPSSGTYKGYICPDADVATLSKVSHPGQTGHYYDGCYDSVAQSTFTTVTTAVQPMKDRLKCTTITNVNNNAESCVSNSGYPKKDTSINATSTPVSTTTAGYSGDSTVVAPTVNSTPVVVSNGSKTCTTPKNSTVTTCTWTRDTTYTSTVVTTVKVGANFSHHWLVNSTSLWNGCVMDRDQDDDTTSAIPGRKFPAENNDSCNVATVMPLSYDWTALNAKIDTMKANGGTNQTIGLAHGMQIQTADVPYNDPNLVLPANTTRYIILLSDGLNTMDRWYGDGSNQSASVDGRMAKACKAAKDQGFVIYTLFVDIAGAQGNSQVLQDCATDKSKYYDLTSSAAIVTAFNDIAQKITNLRVAS